VNLVEVLTERSVTRIRDLFEITRKPRGFGLAGRDTVPFAPMESIPQDGSFDARFQMRPVDRLTSGTYFEARDVLVSKITPCFENGKQALGLNVPGGFGYATTEVIPLHAREENTDTRLLFYYLLHPDVRAFVTSRMEGSTARKRVPDEVLLDLPYPEVTPQDQQSMSRALELIQRGIQVQGGLATAAAALKRAAMRELFTRGLRGEEQKETEIGPTPTSWKLTSIDDRFVVVSGGTPSRGVAAYWSSGTIPWVKTGEVDYSTIDETEEHITAEGLENSAARLLPRGTVLMAMYGQGLTRGRVGVLGIEAACNQACAALLPRDEQVLPRFVYYQLGHRYNEIRGLAHGGQQQNLNMDIVKALALAYPPDLTEQREIVEILDAIDQKIDLHKRKKAVLEELFKALLHKLMTGEIRVSDLDLSALDDVAPAGASA
jgi:type I restriction enzyme S subunit